MHSAARLSLALALTAASAAHADELHVPADYVTIQEAVDAASFDDTILVGPGDYHESIELIGKRLFIKATAGAAHTVLHGGEGPILFASNFIGLGGGLQGFTLTGGSGKLLEDGLTYGGAVFLENATFALLECQFRDNHVTGDGGAIFARSPTNKSFTLRASLLEHNSAGGHGGALALDGVVAQGGLLGGVQRSTFRANHAGGDGGGAWSKDAGGGWSKNVFVDNQAGGSGGGHFARDTKQLLPSMPSNGTFLGNFAGGDGGGLAFTVEVLNTPAVYLPVIGIGMQARGNRASGRGGALFARVRSGVGGTGSLHLEGIRLRNSLLVRNHADLGGGALAQVFEVIEDPMPTFALPQLVLERCTVLFNSATQGGSVIHFESDVLQGHRAESVILGEHTAPWSSGADLQFSFSDVSGGAPGNGNFDADPQFFDPANGVFALRSTSPARDAGAGGLGADVGYKPYTARLDLGHSLHGSLGPPQLYLLGDVLPGASLSLTLLGVDASFPAFLVLGTDPLYASFKSGVLVTVPNHVLPSPPPGSATAMGTWPDGLAPERSFYLQVWVVDPATPAGFAASNAVVLTEPTIP